MYFFICTTTRRCGNRYYNDGDFTLDDDDDSENDHRKNSFRIGKRIAPDQNREQELKLFHGNLK